MNSINMAGEVTSSRKRYDYDNSDRAPTAETLSASSNETKRHYLEVENLNEVPFWLPSCHIIAALFQCMQSVFLFGFSRKVDLRWLVYTNFPAPDDEMMEESNVYATPNPTEIGSYPITFFTGAFIFVSGIDHIFCVAPYFRDIYNYYLQRSQCPFRWYEYSISSPLMKVLIAQVAGITDIHILFLIFFINHSATLFPLIHEKMNARALADGHKVDWSPFFCGLIPYLASMGIIWSYFFTMMQNGETPAYVSLICVALFFLDLLFPLCFVLQWKKVWIFKDYVIGELSFIVLSFTAKTLLAWISLGGALAFSKN